MNEGGTCFDLLRLAQEHRNTISTKLPPGRLVHAGQGDAGAGGTQHHKERFGPATPCMPLHGADLEKSRKHSQVLSYFCHESLCRELKQSIQCSKQLVERRGSEDLEASRNTSLYNLL